MALYEPDDPDDIFRLIVSDIDIATPVDVIDLTQLSDADLSARFNDTREALMAIEEMHPDAEVTPEGRELHSIRAACLIEQRRRAEERRNGGTG